MIYKNATALKEERMDFTRRLGKRKRRFVGFQSKRILVSPASARNVLKLVVIYCRGLVTDNASQDSNEQVAKA